MLALPSCVSFMCGTILSFATSCEGSFTFYLQMVAFNLNISVYLSLYISSLPGHFNEFIFCIIALPHAVSKKVRNRVLDALVL